MCYRLFATIALLSSARGINESNIPYLFSVVASNIFSDVIKALTNTITGIEPPLTSPGKERNNISDICQEHGYVFSEYAVRTDDGYVLALHRIRNATYHRGAVVFLMHGLMDSSDTWAILGPNRSLAFHLADRGYDVWLGNARGNKYSMQHVKYKPTDGAFWDFTWEQIGTHDLVAMIDFALGETSRSNLFYIGHSQGTTAFFVMTSLRPEYNEKIRLMIAFAPVAWVTNIRSPIVRIFSPVHQEIGYLIGNLNQNTPIASMFNKLASGACKLLIHNCENTLVALTGNSKLIDKEDWPTILAHIPSGSSTKQFLHFGQLIESGKFRRFDHGKANLMVYGQMQPPEYDLANITAPISLYYSANDWLSDVEDVNVLLRALPNVYSAHLTNYSHLDYLFAKGASEDVYKMVVGEIEEYESVNATMTDINEITPI